MKNYYIFPDHGSSLEVKEEGTFITVKHTGEFRARFTQEKLIKELEELVVYLKKYGGKKNEK
jgi:hypothetical protein